MGKITLSQMLSQLAGGMGTSIQIFAVTLIFSLPLGLLVAFGRMSKNGMIRNLVKVYISIMRGTPLMLQLMVVYFGPYYLFGIKVGSSYRLWLHLLVLQSITPPILQRSTAAASSPCLWDSMRQPIFWATAGYRRFSGSSCRRS